ncbi:MAG: peptidyl-tRNA hydrolase [Sulfobacillus sp.]
MYILINSDVMMSPGKIAAQASHAVGRIERFLAQHPTADYEAWIDPAVGNERKIVLQAHEKVLNRCIAEFADRCRDLWCAHVIDAGLTELPPQTLTAVAFCPTRQAHLPKYVQRLRCLN